MGLNPLRRPMRVVSELLADTDSDQAEDQPKRWQSRGRLASAKRYITMFPWLIAGLVFFLMALGLFFYPVLPTAHMNGWTVAIGFYVLSMAANHVWTRTSALNTLKKYDLHVLFTGNGAEVRLGKKTGDIDDKTWGFKTLKKFAYGGLSTEFEQFRDRFSRREIADHKDKYHRVDDDGSGEVKDGFLKQTTFSVGQLENGIELFDDIHITHGGEQQTAMNSKERETMTTLPPTLDKRTNAFISIAFRQQVQSTKEAERLRGQLEDYVDELEELVDPRGEAVFEGMYGILSDLGLVGEEQRRRQQGREPLPDRPPEGLRGDDSEDY